MKLSEIKEKQLVQKFFLYFMMYAVFGWCYEVVLETFIYRWGFSNRGVLFGPYCPVYGVGALAFIFSFGWLMRKKDPSWLKFVKPIFIFLGTMAVATFIELMASYIMEFFTGAWPWQTYADYKYNFQARIALSTSIRFGIGGVLFLYLIQPIYEWLLNKPSKKWLNIITLTVVLIVIADIIYTAFFR